MKFVFLALLGLVLAFHPVQGRTLAEAAAQMSQKLKAGCIVTAEFKKGEVKYAIAGKAPEVADAKPENVVFEIGSISKVFTGLLLAQAVVEKKVTLETTVGSLLAGKVKFEDPRVAAITLQQLATHTSGLPCLPDNAMAGALEKDPYANYDENLLMKYLASARLEGEGPFAFSYSNLGVGLLGYLLGEKYQMSWDQAVVEKICRPLGLQNTAVQPQSALLRATPHDDDSETNPWKFISLAGCGALRSTAADLMIFGEAWLHPEKTPLKEAFALALRPQADAPSMGGRIGLGILLGSFDGEATLQHDGGTGGFCSGLQVIPAKEIVRVVLISSNALSGGQVIAGTSEIKPVDPATQKEIVLSPEMLKQYAGVYELDRNSRFTVLLSDGKMFVNLTGQPFLRVFAKAQDRFFYKAVAAEIVFNRHEDGIHSLTLFQNGHEITARRSNASPPEFRLRPAKELQSYVGEYALAGAKPLKVTMQVGSLFAQLEGQPAMPVFETSEDRFEYDVVKAALVFTRDENKQINGLTLLQNGLTIPAPRLKTPTSAPKP